MRPVALAPAALAALLAGPLAAEPLGAHGLSLPASFTGVLPCADCPGIRHQLDLWPEGGFALRRDYIDRDGGGDSLGRWHVDPARGALVLVGPEAMEWQILNDGRLRLMDAEGQPIDSDLPYELDPGPLEPFDLALPMTGEFVYFADAALFTECMTGQRMPVVMEGAYIELERAYLEARAAPMAPLLVRIDGRIAEAEAMEGPPRRSVHVEALEHVTPGGACQGPGPAELINSYWILTELDGRAVGDLEGRREPHLVLLQQEGTRFAATVGCNQMIGSFSLDGDALEFGPAAATRMACPPPLDAAEAALGAALDATRSHDSDGRALRLFDAEGRILARFEAAYTP